MGEANAGATYANEQFRVRGVPEKATIRGTAAVGSAKCPKLRANYLGKMGLGGYFESHSNCSFQT
jgi:hypothetical protein